MYTCRKCKNSVDDSDRYCFSCGAYIGEPVRRRDYLEDDEGEVQLDTIHNKKESSFEKINSILNEYIKQITGRVTIFCKSPLTVAAMEVENTSYKSTIALTIGVFFMIPLMFSLLIKYALPIPNDLLDIVLPFKITDVDFKGRLNLPKEFYLSFLYLFTGFVLTICIDYLIIYLSSRVLFNSWKSSLKLWKALMVSQMPYGLTLVIYLSLSFISSIAANIALIMGMIVWVVAAYQAIYIFSENNSNKALLITVGGLATAYMTFYGYVYILMR